MKIGRWFKKAVCLLLVWGLILAAAGGTPVLSRKTRRKNLFAFSLSRPQAVHTCE